MNGKRRMLLNEALRNLEDAENKISIALDEEEDCLSNLPENLEGSDMYDKMEEAVQHLEDALENLNTAKSEVEDAIQ